MDVYTIIMSLQIKLHNNIILKSNINSPSVLKSVMLFISMGGFKAGEFETM